MIYPSVVVRDDLAAELDEWVRHARGLVAAWGKVGEQAGQAWGTTTSAFAADMQAFRLRHPEAAVNVEGAPADYAGVYITAIAQHVLAVAALFESRQVALSVWPVIRAELEIAGRIRWLLDPGSADHPVSGEQRVARFLMESLASWCRERFTASKLCNRALEKATKVERDRMRETVTGIFPEAAVSWTAPGDEKGWTVLDENYLGLGPGADEFVRAVLGDVRGLYDILSDYSHPSLVRLRVQSSRNKNDEGFSELSYVVGREVLNWQAEVACLVLYKAAHHVIGYFGLDDGPLEAWAGGAPADWFTSDGEVTE